MVDAFFGPEPLQKRDGLGETREPRGRWVEGQTHHRVVRLVPAGAESDVNPSVGKEIERGDLLREHHGIAVVVGEHESTHAESRRGSGSHGQRRYDRECSCEVVGDVQLVVAERLEAHRLLTPCAGVRSVPHRHHEAERARLVHQISLDGLARAVTVCS
jgi:hypothetical protein